jgi:hypothetical protein
MAFPLCFQEVIDAGGNVTAHFESGLEVLRPLRRTLNRHEFHVQFSSTVTCSLVASKIICVIGSDERDAWLTPGASLSSPVSFWDDLYAAGPARLFFVCGACLLLVCWGTLVLFGAHAFTLFFLILTLVLQWVQCA